MIDRAFKTNLDCIVEIVGLLGEARASQVHVGLLDAGVNTSRGAVNSNLCRLTSQRRLRRTAPGLFALPEAETT